MSVAVFDMPRGTGLAAPRSRATAAGKTFFLLSLPVWTLLAALSLLDSLWSYWSDEAEAPLLAASSYWTGYYLVWALLAPLLYLLNIRWRLDRRPAPVLIAAYLGLCLLTLVTVELLAAVATQLIAWPFAGGSPGEVWLSLTATLSAQFEQPLVNRYDRSFFIFFGTIAAIHFFDYYAGAEADRKHWLRGRLRALRLEMNPHFLFNTLHGVTLLIEQQPAVAERMLVRLSDYLRKVLRESHEDRVSLRKELEFAREYVDIEQLRFGDRLLLDIHDPADLGDALVPTMLLQPLIENALLHGPSASSPDGISIVVSVERRGDRLLLAVRNPVVAAATESVPRRGLGGIGHGNMRERLAALYGDDFAMSSQPIGLLGYLIEIDIPLQMETEADAQH
jgi:hypothetical protein